MTKRTKILGYNSMFSIRKRFEYTVQVDCFCIFGVFPYQGVNFECLEKYMELSIQGQEFIDISASAISIICVLINRNIKHIKTLQKFPLVEDENHEAFR